MPAIAAGGQAPAFGAGGKTNRASIPIQLVVDRALDAVDANDHTIADLMGRRFPAARAMPKEPGKTCCSSL